MLLHFLQLKSVFFTEINPNSEVFLTPKTLGATLPLPSSPGEWASARTQPPISWLTPLNGCLNDSRQIPDTAFPPLALFFFSIPIIGSCMLVESLLAPYDSLNGEGGEGVGGGCIRG